MRTIKSFENKSDMKKIVYLEDSSESNVKSLKAANDHLKLF